jgi:hypothetical protein
MLFEKPSTLSIIYRRNAKLINEDVLCLLLFTPCLHINEESCQTTSEDTQKPLCQKKKTHSLNNDHDKILPSPESALSQPSQEKKLFEISNLLEWGYNIDGQCANAINQHSDVNLLMRNIILTFCH